MAHTTKGYIVKVLIGFDQFVNCLFNGDPDETISSRIGRAKRDGRMSWTKKPYLMLIYEFLNILDPGHCDTNIEE